MLYGDCVDSICILHNSQRENHKVIRWWKKSILRPFSSLLNFGWECNHLVQLLVSQFCTNHVLQAIQVTYPRQCHPSGCGPHFLELQHYYRASVECLHCPLLQDYDSFVWILDQSPNTATSRKSWVCHVMRRTKFNKQTKTNKNRL